MFTLACREVTKISVTLVLIPHLPTNLDFGMRPTQLLQKGRSAWKGEYFLLTARIRYTHYSRSLLRCLSQPARGIDEPCADQDPGQVVYDSAQFRGVRESNDHSSMFLTTFWFQNSLHGTQWERLRSSKCDAGYGWSQTRRILAYKEEVYIQVRPSSQWLFFIS